MRLLALTLALTLALSLLSLSAHAHRRKHRHHATATAAAPRSESHPSASERNAQEYARAEAELADLRAGRVSTQEDAQTDMPAQTWAVQENDAEVPAPLRQKNR